MIIQQIEIWKKNIDFYDGEIKRISNLDPTSKSLLFLQKERDSLQQLYEEGMETLRFQEESLKSQKEVPLCGLMGFDEEEL